MKGMHPSSHLQTGSPGLLVPPCAAHCTGKYHMFTVSSVRSSLDSSEGGKSCVDVSLLPSSGSPVFLQHARRALDRADVKVLTTGRGSDVSTTLFHPECLLFAEEFRAAFVFRRGGSAAGPAATDLTLVRAVKSNSSGCQNPRCCVDNVPAVACTVPGTEEDAAAAAFCPPLQRSPPPRLCSRAA